MKLTLAQKIWLNSVSTGYIFELWYYLKKSKAIYLSDLNLIYIPIPKVACHSIKTALAKKINLDISSVPNVHKANWNKIAKAKLLNRSTKTFAFVRNPLDRLVSCFHHKLAKDPYFILWKYGRQISRDMSFRQFAEFVINKPDSLSDFHFRSQHKFLYVDNQNLVDYLLKFETLKEDWQWISNVWELPDLGHSNKTQRNGYLDYYDYDLAKRVSQRYGRDIHLFGYTNQIKTDLDQLKKQSRTKTIKPDFD